MSEKEAESGDVDWSVTTWEGSRREQLRRWAALPLERIVAAVEEMEGVIRFFDTKRKARSSIRK
ncbi:MAG: hypothetical protein H0W33_03820 [Gammaproteobacteria bacterium]|nr:hypothetical protein [Gammaproteobacteria bacterium]